MKTNFVRNVALALILIVAVVDVTGLNFTNWEKAYKVTVQIDDLVSSAYQNAFKTVWNENKIQAAVIKGDMTPATARADAVFTEMRTHINLHILTESDARSHNEKLLGYHETFLKAVAQKLPKFSPETQEQFKRILEEAFGETQQLFEQLFNILPVNVIKEI